MHNRGLVRSTKYGVPWKLEYTEEYDTLSSARRRELKIKSWKRRDYLDELIENSR